MKKRVIVGEDAPRNVTEALENIGYSVIRLPRDDRVDAPIASHADLFFCHDGRTLFADEIAYNRTKEHLFDSGEAILIDRGSDTRLSYPDDCGLCVKWIGDRLIANPKCLHPRIAAYAKECGVRLIPVKQGYAACNLARINENAAITEDEGIARVLIKDGCDVLLLRTHAATLRGYAYGFIGGASGTDKSTVYFCGCVEKHPEFSRIRDFALKHAVSLVSLSSEELTDVGGLVFLP